ncbi:MAG TPA: nucleotide sugar dehydrogenase [Verrucomicrobiae bacterium]|nr:nucleotide sugar dehydrogenase [Verrucomicrobiae bacterium]
MSDGANDQKYDVCVIGGAGHVGAPLAIVFANKGVRTLVYDVNERALGELRAGRMPHLENGAEPELARALKGGALAFTSDASCVANAGILVVTIGTPIDEFHNPRLDVVTKCLDLLLPYMHDGQSVILRSTVFPGVTEFVDHYLRQHGKNLPVAFCPERVVQGNAIEELQTLPQIVSGTTTKAEKMAAALFGRIAPSIVTMVVKEAEFAKLLTNAYRYIQFAAANQFYMMVEAAGLDHARLLAGLKQDYPRLRDLPGPGFAAGPCLMKDTMQLVAFENNHFSLGSTAMMVNEGLPNFIVERLKLRHTLRSKRVGILGMAFKADVDDIRDALSYKLGKILRFEGAAVSYSDEFAKDPTFVSAEKLVDEADIVVVGVPHSAYKKLPVPKRVDLVDLWGVIRPELRA